VSLEKQISARTSSLEGAKGELEAFTYSVAHDLRAPLRAMVGFGQTLLEDYIGKSLDETGRTYLERMIESARKMDALIQDLLAFSRLGREEVRLESVDLDQVVRKVLSELSPEIQARKAEVTVGNPLPRVLAHPTVAAQVLTNLVSNALKFVAPGAHPKVLIRSEGVGDRERLFVRDNGIGIAERHHERVFQVFERLNKIEEYPGTGIGLAIVKRAIERMGGKVGFESRVDQGSTFWVEFLRDEP
jgi:signal transduction histidine kinase